MKLAFVGMSGSGKSYWSQKLEEKGFTRFCCDDLIEEKLGSELKLLGYSGIQDVAKWMGQPFDKQYGKTSKMYLAFENEVMREILNGVEKSSQNENIVIDTTGSVIYTGKEVLDKLSNLNRVIYLETPTSVQEEMYQLYLKDPKPVIWGNSFNQKQGEEEITALGRCYPELLSFRTQRYEKMGNITLSYHRLRSPGYTISNLMEVIEND